MEKLGRSCILLLLVVCLTGCNTLSKNTLYIIDDNNIEFDLPKVWKQIDSNENDLLLSRPDANLTIDTYHQSELDGMPASALLDKKIEEKMSTMEEYRLVKEYKVNELIDRKIYSALYSGTSNGVETQYYFNVMELNGTHTYVYALYTEKEIYMKYNIDDIQRMLIRMKWNGEEDLVLN